MVQLIGLRGWGGGSNHPKKVLRNTDNDMNICIGWWPCIDQLVRVSINVTMYLGLSLGSG